MYGEMCWLANTFTLMSHHAHKLIVSVSLLGFLIFRPGVWHLKLYKSITIHVGHSCFVDLALRIRHHYTTSTSAIQMGLDEIQMIIKVYA